MSLPVTDDPVSWAIEKAWTFIPARGLEQKPALTAPDNSGPKAWRREDGGYPRHTGQECRDILNYSAKRYFAAFQQAQPNKENNNIRTT